MKSFKNLDIKNNKVLLGLFSLLFILVTAQTAAILRTQDSIDANSQTSQVVSSSGCVTISPTYNMDDVSFEGPESTDPGNRYYFYMHYKITNNCIYNIKILDTSALHMGMPIQTPKSFGAQVYNSASPNSPINVTDFLNNVYNIRMTSEIVNCVDCGDGAHTFHASPVGTNGLVRVFTLGGGQTRTMQAFTSLELPDVQPSYIFRATLKNVKWIRESALSDGTVSASEINTLNLHTSFVNANASDYIRIQHGGGFSSDFTGGETKGNQTMVEVKPEPSTKFNN